MNIKNIFRDDLAKDSVIMFLGTGFTNFFNLLYTVFLTRNLSPSDFGLFNSLLSISMLLSQLPSAVSIAVTRFVSQFYAQQNSYKIKRFIIWLNKRILLIGFFIFLILIALHKPLSDFLKISNGNNFLLLGLMVLCSYLSVLPQSTLVGLQKFWYISFTSVVSGLAKLFFVFIFIKLMFGVSGALMAFLISSFLGLIISFYFQRKSLYNTIEPVFENKNFDFGGIYSYLFPVFIVTLVGTAFLNIDIILVKRFFEPFEAGLYSISQVVGKIVFFFPSFLITVMFPKVASFQAKNKDTRIILKKSLLYMFFLSVIVALFTIAFPELVLKVITGKVYRECFLFVRIFSINMVLLSIIFVFMNYYLSLDKRKYLYIFLFAVILEVSFISLFQKSLIQILSIIFILFMLLLILNLYLVFCRIE